MKVFKNRQLVVLIVVSLITACLSQVDYVDVKDDVERINLDQHQEQNSYEVDSDVENEQSDQHQTDVHEGSDGQHGGSEGEHGGSEGGHEGSEGGHEGSEGGHGGHYLSPSEPAFWINVLLAAICTIIGAFCSGMGVGLMSIEKMQLQIMSLGGDEQQKKIAKRILAVVSDHHLFLVTLLVYNAIGLESLPIIIHSLVPAWVAILLSTFVVLIAAEIVPQAICTGPKKMMIAYYAAPIIQTMIKIACFIVYPMARGLDKVLGQHKHQRIQHKDFANFLTGGSQNLKSTEKLLLTSILQLRSERVPKIMVQIKDLYMLQLYERLTQSKINEINQKDFSYILVYKGEDRKNVVGVVKTKQFALKYLKAQAKGEKYQTVNDIFQQKHDLLSVYEDANLLEMLMLFQAKSHRFALVIGKKKKVEPGIQSIMYSKSDMVANKNEAEIKGVVFLYSIFEEIAEYNQQVTDAIARGEKPNLSKAQNSYEMKQLKRPLIEK